jgi:HAMP domain-containing protein
MKRRRSSLLVKIGIAVTVTEVVILAVIGVAYMVWFAQRGIGPAGETPVALLTQPGWRTVVIYGVGAGLLTFLLLSVAILYLLNSMILGRLRLLNAAVQQVQNGDVTARVAGPFASDEIGELQTGVNALVARFSERVETLECRVAERARALEREALLRQTILEVGRRLLRSGISIHC